MSACCICAERARGTCSVKQTDPLFSFQTHVKFVTFMVLKHYTLLSEHLIISSDVEA